MGWRDLKYAHWNWGIIRVLDDWESRGYMMTGICRALFATWIGVYGVVALTKLGEAAQDCTTKTVKLGGLEIQTSSVVSTVLAIEGVFNAVFTPLFGAIADSSSHRTQLFRGTLSLLATSILVLGVLLFFAGETWTLLAVAVVSIFGALLFELQTVLHAAYLPELTTAEDLRLKISARYHSIGSSMQLLFIGATLALTVVLGVSEDGIASAQVGVAVAFVLWAFWAVPGMALLDSRPKTAEQKQAAGFCGFYGIYVNIRLCLTKYKQIAIFLAAYSFYISGCNALVSLATSYLLTELGIGGFDIQVLIGVSLIFTIPGALLSTWLCKKFGNLKRLVLAVVGLWIIIIITIPLFLQGEDDPDGKLDPFNPCSLDSTTAVSPRRPKGFSGIAVYVEAVFWGLALGLVYPINWALMAELVPGGSEAGFFGLKTFAGKVLSWSPPLLFTVINEATLNPRIAICSMLPFMVIGFLLLLFLDLEKGREQIEDTLHLRFGYVEDLEQTLPGLAQKSNQVSPSSTI